MHEALCQSLGCTIEYRPETTWRKVVNGTWIGIIGSVNILIVCGNTGKDQTLFSFQILNGSADIGAHHFQLSNSAEVPITFGPSTFEFETNLHLMQPTLLMPILNLVQPFSSVVYICIALSCILVLCASIIIFKFHSINGPLWFLITTTTAHSKRVFKTHTRSYCPAYCRFQIQQLHEPSYVSCNFCPCLDQCQLLYSPFL